MKSETIRQYTPITPLEALKLLVENDGEQVEGFAFKDTSDAGWVVVPLTGVDIHTEYKFGTVTNTRFNQCAKVTELDPSEAPEGCPELEPWMAYVGKASDEVTSKIRLFSDENGSNPHAYISIGSPYPIMPNADPDNMSHDGFYFIDVRTAWAQENFPDHCRIRNYQEPGAFELEWQALKDEHGLSIKDWFRKGYKRGQANPVKGTK